VKLSTYNIWPLERENEHLAPSSLSMTAVLYLIQGILSGRNYPRGVHLCCYNTDDNCSLTPDPVLASPHAVSGCKKRKTTPGPEEASD
jgi:hypothetical protein